MSQYTSVQRDTIAITQATEHIKTVLNGGQMIIGLSLPAEGQRRQGSIRKSVILDGADTPNMIIMIVVSYVITYRQVQY